jgi:Zn-dependent peptidase ImmA (M78 family)/DNA-binding XRE family transcriptional regulator
MISTLDSQDPRILGERLKSARSNAGLTQDEAAQKLDLARTTLLAIEKGQRRVRPDELRQMADLYRSSVNNLLRPSAVHVDLVPRFRTLPATLDKPAVDATRLLNDLAAAEVELECLVGQPLKTNYPPERPILPGDVREQAEDAAAELRHRLGIGLAPISDAVSLLELELGIRVFVRPLSNSALSGLFIFDEKVGACVLLNQDHPRARRALTAAHEVGHLISARQQPDVVDLGRGPQSREEKYAHAFALAFMMPAPLVRRRFQEFQRETGGFSPRHLILMAHSLNVSQEAMSRRLEELKLIPGGTWESLRDRGFSGDTVRQVLGDQMRPPDEFVMPPRLWLLAAEAYRRELLSEGQLARMLRMNRVEIRMMLDALDADGVDDFNALAVG